MFSQHQSSSDGNTLYPITSTASPPAYTEGGYRNQAPTGFHRNNTHYPTLSPPSTVSGAPPAYSTYGRNEQKRSIEISEPSIASPVESRRNSGVSRHTTDNRFRRILKFGAIGVVLLLALFFIIFFLVLRHDISVTTTSLTTSIPVVTRQLTKSTAAHVPYETTPDSISCSPSDPTTFLYAYSNDLQPDLVLYAWSYFAYTQPHFSLFASIRFDVRDEDEIHYHSNYEDVKYTLLSHLPNSSLGFTDFKTGTDVLKAIEKFIDNEQFPACGSYIFILVKRYPSLIDIGKQVSKLRQHHVMIFIQLSLSQSGGSNPEILYNLATRTNGFFSAVKDEDMIYTTGFFPGSSFPYLIYAANPVASGQGMTELTPMTVPSSGVYYIATTMTEYKPIDLNYDNAELKWYNSGSPNSNSLGVSHSGSSGIIFGNSVSSQFNLDQMAYNMALTYDYKSYAVQQLQIRVYSEEPINYWIPYDD